MTDQQRENESSESRLSEWKVLLDPGKAEPMVCVTATGGPIHAAEREGLGARGAPISETPQFKRALLVSRAPTLHDAARACRDVFRVMAERGIGRERDVGLDMLPLLESALYPIE